MDALNSNNLFNASGLAAILSFFSINVMNVAHWASVNIVLLVFIGITSLIFGIMKIYHQYLVTKRFKKRNKDKE